MYLCTTVPHPHGHVQFQEVLGNRPNWSNPSQTGSKPLFTPSVRRTQWPTSRPFVRDCQVRIAIGKESRKKPKKFSSSTSRGVQRLADLKYPFSDPAAVHVRLWCILLMREHGKTTWNGDWTGDVSRDRNIPKLYRQTTTMCTHTRCERIQYSFDEIATQGNVHHKLRRNTKYCGSSTWETKDVHEMKYEIYTKVLETDVDNGQGF